MAFEHRDLATMLERNNVFWFADEPDAQRLQLLLPLAERLAESLHVLVPPASNRRAPDYVERVRRLLQDVVSFGTMSLTTKVTQSRRAIGNLIGNLVRYAAAESLVDWKGRWRGYPAIVVSAGPSLARNRGLLAEAQGKALIVVVGTALKQVLAVGVQPDLVVHIDHSDLCTRHFEGIGAPGQTILLAEATASPNVLAAWPGRLAMARHAFAEHLLGPLARPMPQLPQGMTVAHTAFYAAEYVGADPIIFVGQDLAFTDGLYYSPGNGLHELWQGELNRFCTVETKEWERLVRRKSQLVTTPGIDGEPLLADRQMLHYLRQFERDFARTSATVVDATEGGARKAGTEVMALEMALSRHLREAFPAAWTAPIPIARPVTDRAIAPVFAEARRRMAEFQKTANEIVRRQRRALDASPENETTFAQDISALQQKVQAQFRVEFQLAAAFDGALELEKQRRTRQLEAATLSDKERLRLAIERDVDYVAGLAEAAGAILELLDDSKPGLG
jgi:hypothetical protein